jgi:hypothetical protein
MTTDTLEKLNTGTDTLCYAGQWILKTDGNSLDSIPEEFATPIHKIRTKTILSSAMVAERAQRNWDYNRPVLEADIDTITKACTTMPTKQQLPYYTLIASTDLIFNQACYKIAIDEENPDFNREHHRNGQVLAPLLLIFLQNNVEKILENEAEKDLHEHVYEEIESQLYTSIGISSGVAAFSASMLGYKTGFCACMIYDQLIDLLETKNVPSHVLLPEGNALFLGIGHPNDSFDRKDIVVNNEVMYTAETRDKIIDVIHI